PRGAAPVHLPPPGPPPTPAGARASRRGIYLGARFARVAGVVRSISGEPLPGVHVASSAEGFSADCVDGSSVSQGLSGPSTATDAEGRFELPGLPKEGAYLQFFSADAESAFHPLSPDDDAAQLSIQMRARCHFRVEPLQPEAGNLGANFALLDDLDQPIAVTLQRPGTKVSATGFDLTDGRSPVLRAGEGRFTLLVRGAFGERRSSVWLRPGDVNVLHY
ncbi:MAG: carboxypeptidase-like regulatory domain-containing protein, partial [Planctomycetota bacterium]